MGIIDLYYMPLSAPCRAVHMAAKEYSLEINYKLVNLKTKDNHKPEFLKINPTRLLPTIDDNGFYLWESAAIMTYFSNKYGPTEDPLYPREPQVRASVDKILHYYNGTLYPCFYNYFIPQIFEKKQPDHEAEKKLIVALNDLEALLNGDYLVGNNHTLGDIAVLATVVSIENFEWNLNKWPKTEAWMKRLKCQLPYYHECNDEGLKDHKNMFLSRNN